MAKRLDRRPEVYFKGRKVGFGQGGLKWKGQPEFSSGKGMRTFFCTNETTGYSSWTSQGKT